MGKKSGGTTNVQADPSVGKAQLKMAEVAEREQDWYENEMYPWLVNQTQESNRQLDEDRQMYQQNYDFWQKYATDNADKWNERADEYYDRWKNSYVPVEDALLSDAARYNEGAEAERQAQLAYGDSATAYAQQRQAQNMQLQQYGINPTAGAYRGQTNAMALQQAAIQAQAATQARQAANELGWNKNMQLAALGQNYAQNALGAAGQGTSTATGVGGLANSSLAGAGQATQSALGNTQNLANIGLSSYQSLGNAWGNYGNLGMQLSNFNLQQAQANAQAKQASSQGVGAMVGSIATTAAVAI